MGSCMAVVSAALWPSRCVEAPLCPEGSRANEEEAQKWFLSEVLTVSCSGCGAGSVSLGAPRMERGPAAWATGKVACEWDAMGTDLWGQVCAALGRLLRAQAWSVLGLPCGSWAGRFPWGLPEQDVVPVAGRTGGHTTWQGTHGPLLQV